jgi:hypothetical protein
VLRGGDCKPWQTEPKRADPCMRSFTAVTRVQTVNAKPLEFVTGTFLSAKERYAAACQTKIPDLPSVSMTI